LTRESLWAPWRIEYIKKPDKSRDGCVFCNALKNSDDRESLMLFRGAGVFMILNRYPYNPGHLMIVPNRHVSDPGELDAAESSELWTLMVKAKAALEKSMGPHAYNIGFNLGPAAGAGIADHIHLHVVPRWSGDTNFMPVLGGTRVISEQLSETYDAVLAALELH